VPPCGNRSVFGSARVATVLLLVKTVLLLVD
jgi:hypothetical protein